MLGWRCNASCVQCWQMASRKTGALKHNEIDTGAVSSLMSMYRGELEHIELCSFGEPMLNRNFGEILDLIIKTKHPDKWNNINIISNGSLLDKHMIIGDLPGVLAISFDAPEKALYESIRRGLNFDAVLKNMISLSRRKNHPRRYLGVNMTVFERNKHAVYDMAKLLTNIGFHYFAIIRGDNLVMTDVPDELLQPEEPCVGEQIDRAKKDFVNLVYQDYFRTPGGTKANPKATHCELPWIELDISNDGIMHPCCRSYDVSLGHWSSGDQWMSPRMMRLREQIVARNVDKEEFPSCHSCPLL